VNENKDHGYFCADGLVSVAIVIMDDTRSSVFVLFSVIVVFRSKADSRLTLWNALIGEISPQEVSCAASGRTGEKDTKKLL
jgi:hypothetical protein